MFPVMFLHSFLATRNICLFITPPLPILTSISSMDVYGDIAISNKTYKKSEHVKDNVKVQKTKLKKTNEQDCSFVIVCPSCRKFTTFFFFKKKIY